MKAKLSAGVLAAILAALLLASPAGAWKVVLNDFVNQGGSGAAYSVAKKCKGGKVGYYNWTGRIVGGDQVHQVEAELPAFPKWKQLKDVKFTIYGEGFDLLPPEHQLALLNGYGAFYETMFTRHDEKKDKLFTRHQGVIIFGSYVIPPGESVAKFKPKQGC